VEDVVIKSARCEVTALRLYSRTPGTDRLRKSAAGELRQMLAAGWQETGRTIHTDHVLVRMERPLAKTPRMSPLRPGNDAVVRRRG
jgi:hypothetical protein